MADLNIELDTKSKAHKIASHAMPDAGIEQKVVFVGVGSFFLQLSDGSEFTISSESGGDVEVVAPGVTGNGFVSPSEMNNQSEYEFFVIAAASGKTLQLDAWR